MRLEPYLRIGAVVVALSSSAFAGGPRVSTVQDGNWLSNSTWDAGRPPLASNFEQAAIDHEVLIDGTVDSFSTAVAATTPGTIAIDGNSFNSQLTTIGSGGGLGRIDISAGALVSGVLTVGSSSDGLVHIRGGALTVSQELRLGVVGDGTLLVEGGAATIDLTAATFVDFGGRGRLVARPTANGVAGLTTIQAGDAALDSNARLELDTSAYTPQVGDEWVVLSYSPTLAALSFSVVEAPLGYTVEQDTSVAGQLTLRVTGVASAVPASSWPGNLLLIGGLLIALVVLSTHRRGL